MFGQTVYSLNIHTSTISYTYKHNLQCITGPVNDCTWGVMEPIEALSLLLSGFSVCSIFVRIVYWQHSPSQQFQL